jgi:hypothetical protein
MTRKHFEAIAARFSHALTLIGTGTRDADTARNAVWRVALDIADDLANENPRFDRARFVKACEPK